MMQTFVPSNRVAWIDLKAIIVILEIRYAYEVVDSHLVPADVGMLITENGKSLDCKSGINILYVLLWVPGIL